MAKILVVDDDTGLVLTIQQWLEHERHLVEIAYDGVDGGHLLSGCDYDLVVLDWNIPYVSGLELCKQLRARRSPTRILILTGRSDIDDKEVGFLAGADDYLTKPFEMRELVFRVRSLLKRSIEATPNVITCGSISLDIVKHRVTKDGDELRLSPRDFALLEFFMRHPGQAFSSDALLQRVWQSDSDATNDALRSSVKRLRQRIDDGADESGSLIETIPKVGYRFRG